MNFHFASFFRTLQLITQALLCKEPDETVSSPLVPHCSQCPQAAAAESGSLLDM